ncbi:divergent polysaccharide deacetylase family protein [Methylosinus sp. H3A]|uniref:divergent polysaccharide deacetylase family protein n=1 Tax=Methylosinus sp. H3A TaxID=2785786 RepID=UPI0018C2988D|nr:divergent polysaccharide deacetylase family protein [Methylosinus sp. H3A]MBG0809240.1 divergent polysaccharide deacetylase family protein [Methylosinus sp. H3A]
MTDELNEPLGSSEPLEPRRTPRPNGRTVTIVATALLGGACLAAFLLATRDPHAGQPIAIARIEMVEPPPAPASAPAEHASVAEPDRRADEIADIERRSGVKVTRIGGGEPPGALIIRLDEQHTALAPAPDKRLVEKGRLPKIGADGAKPMEVYARPATISSRLPVGAPRIALIVGGVGLNAQLTASAIDELPGAVTLALAPYGADPESVATRARERGHEILLQAPMEPYDYPRENPGPHTLLTTRGAGLEDLHWLMSRFSGYIGIVNFLGAQFTADETALTPTLTDIAGRGLLYLDDGTSPRSLVSSLAPRLALSAARADVAIEVGASGEAVEKALTQIEALARRNGQAIIVAGALPQAMTRLARFARELERKGIALVPLSALVSRVEDKEARAGKWK